MPPLTDPRRPMDRQFSLRNYLQQALLWALLIVPLELAWEVVQLPLYTAWRTKTAARLTYDVLHCTAGDAFIGFATYLAAALLLRSPYWPDASPISGAAVAIVLGTAYSAGSEWYHVSLQDWTYTPTMPWILGVGTAPLLQWLLIPPVAVLLYRGLVNRRGAKI